MVKAKVCKVMLEVADPMLDKLLEIQQPDTRKRPADDQERMRTQAGEVIRMANEELAKRLKVIPTPIKKLNPFKLNR